MKHLCTFFISAFIFMNVFIGCSSDGNNNANSNNTENTTTAGTLQNIAAKLSTETGREVVANSILHIAYSQLQDQPLETMEKLFPKGAVLYNRDKDMQFWKSFTIETEGRQYEGLVSTKDVYIMEKEVNLELLLENFTFE